MYALPPAVAAGVGVTAAWCGSVIGVLVAAATAVLYILWFLVMALRAVLPRQRAAAAAAQRRLVNASNGYSITSAAKAPKHETCGPDLGYGTLGRIAAFIRQQPQLQPCFAVAMHDRYFAAYRRYMDPIGTTGLLFASRFNEPDNE